MEFPSSQNHLKTAGIPGVFCIFLRTLMDPGCPETTSKKALFGATGPQNFERGNILPYMVSDFPAMTVSFCFTQTRDQMAWESVSKNDRGNIYLFSAYPGLQLCSSC